MTNQLTYPEALLVLRAAYEQEKIQLTAKISTLEVAIGQQQIQIKQLEFDLMQWILSEGNLFNSESITEMELTDGTTAYISKRTGERLNA